MPLVRIDLPGEKAVEFCQRLSDAIHGALVDALDVPKDDRFHIVTQHKSSEQPAQKRNLYQRIVSNLEDSLGINPDDVMIVLTEVAWQNWSFGQGKAHYAS